MTTVEILKKARGLVEKGWTATVFARDADGLPIHETDRRAVCWCASGALHASGSPWGSDARTVFIRAIGTGEIPDWNDSPGRTQSEVLAAFDKAIALARSAP